MFKSLIVLMKNKLKTFEMSFKTFIVLRQELVKPPLIPVGRIDEYDIIMPVPRVRVTSQINCGDVTRLIRKGRPWRQWRFERSTIVFSGFVCSGHKIACKKYNDVWAMVNNDFCHSWGDTSMHFTRDFVTREKSLPNRLTRLYHCSAVDNIVLYWAVI